MYKNATYLNNLSGSVCGIVAEKANYLVFIPLDPANSDYQQIMKLVQEGKLIIADAESA